MGNQISCEIISELSIDDMQLIRKKLHHLNNMAEQKATKFDYSEQHI
jgi:flagellar motor switch protein FliG